MDPTIALVALFAVAAVALLPRIVRRMRFVRRVDKIPGPPAYPIVGTLLPLLLAPRNKVASVSQEQILKYQPIMRTWIGSSPLIYITRPEIIEALVNSTKHLDKSLIYKFVLPWLGTGLLTSTGQKWHTHRKMITPTFHFKILDNFVEVFSEKSKILISKLQKEVGSKGFDVYPYITHCALDIICETAMGTPVHAQKSADSKYVTALYDMSELIIRRVNRPWFHPDALYRLTKDGKRHAECLSILHGFTNKVIQERKLTRKQSKQTSQVLQGSDDIGGKKRVAFLDMLLEAADNGAQLTDEEIREEVDTFMFEGHDTTSAAVCWALFLLGLHPDVQDKAYEEQEQIFEGSDRPPTMMDLNEMKYLERVIKESLRIYPSVPTFSRLLKEDIELGGYTIPAGCSVRISVFLNHRNPDQFPNPEKFDPDNFLPERVVKRHPYAYIPFSAGPRNCIGQKFALLEEKTVLSYILRHYSLRSLDKREDINLVMELIMRPEKGIRLTISPRNKESKKL